MIIDQRQPCAADPCDQATDEPVALGHDGQAEVVPVIGGRHQQKRRVTDPCHGRQLYLFAIGARAESTWPGRLFLSYSLVRTVTIGPSPADRRSIGASGPKAPDGYVRGGLLDEPECCRCDPVQNADIELPAMNRRSRAN